MEVYISNGWALYQHKLMAEILEKIERKVEELILRFEASGDDRGMLEHPTIKFYYAVTDNMYYQVPENPQNTKYLLGNTLINTNSFKKALKSDSKSFLRVKRQGLPDRYRLFFRFNSSAPQSIIYIWLNSEKTLRKESSKTDVYNVFAKMMNKGDVAASYKDLMVQSQPMKKPE